MITPKDRKMFTNGACHVLAQALHKATGWPIYTFSRHGIPDYHAFIRTPRKTYLDVTGEREPNEFFDDWDCYTVRRVRSDAGKHFWRSWDEDNGYRHRASEKRAKELVPELLRMYYDASKTESII